MGNPTPEPSKNGMMTLLSNLASGGDNTIKLATLALVAFSGIGNWFTTNQNAEQNRQKIEEVRNQAAHEIHEVYLRVQDAADDFKTNVQNIAKARQLAEENAREVQQAMEGLKAALANHNRLLDNQAKMLQSQETVLRILEANQQKGLSILKPPQQ